MDLIVISIIVIILALSITYIVREKKKGVKCIGCPLSKTCSGHCKSADDMPEFISTKRNSKHINLL